MILQCPKCHSDRIATQGAGKWDRDEKSIDRAMCDDCGWRGEAWQTGALNKRDFFKRWGIALRD